MSSTRHIIRAGFTLVELMIVIAVIGILATITIVSYEGVKGRAKDTTLQSDLSNAAESVETYAALHSRSLPQDQTTFNTLFSPSPKITLTYTLAPTKITYDGLSNDGSGSVQNVQNGVLFLQVCNDLIAQGYGVIHSLSGQTANFIGTGGSTACNVYNKGDIQVNNSWNSITFNTPVSSNVLTDYANSLHFTDSWWPDQTTVAQKFYNDWNSKFLEEGGVYPVTIFFDGTWCSVGQAWCTAYQPLPPPTIHSPAIAYCIQAVYQDYSQNWYIQQDKTPEKGNCPVS